MHQTYTKHNDPPSSLNSMIPGTLELLQDYYTDFAEERAFADQTTAFVTSQANFWKRSTLAGHLTGSAWVLSADFGSVLLLHHLKLDRWLQPGGHADDTDGSLIETAHREAVEECGIPNLRLISARLFDLDIHVIPAKGTEPEHLHYDFRFLFVAPEQVVVERNTVETKDIAWVSIPDLLRSSTPQSLRRMALKTLIFQRNPERF